jgi:hypothetical protein
MVQRYSDCDTAGMMPRTVKSWVHVGALVAFFIAALVAQHHDGTGVMPALASVVIIAAMVAFLWVVFVAGKMRQERRTRR